MYLLHPISIKLHHFHNFVYLLAMPYLEGEKKKEEKEQQSFTRLSVIGVCNLMFPMLVSELLEVTCLQKPGGIRINLYDIHANYSETTEFLNDVVEDLLHLTPYGCLKMFHVVDSMREILTDCELLIVLGDFTRRNTELENDWLTRNMSAMFMLADEINAFAKRYLRVVLAIDGPACFNASVLIETCTAIRIQNIVAVTSDIGLGPLQKAADQVNVHLSSLGAPPVWGFVGLNHFVDVQSAVMCCDMYLPYRRVLKNKGGSTLPLGVIQPELRFLDYLLNDVDKINDQAVKTREIVKKQLHRPPIFAKVRATVSLLRLWYTAEPSDDIISLGVCANGSYGIPAGLIFSQPAILKDKIWVPFKNFPLTATAKREIENMIPLAIEATEKMSIKSRIVSSASYNPYGNT